MKKEDKRHLMFLLLSEMTYAAIKYLFLMMAIGEVIDRNMPYVIIYAIITSQMDMNCRRACDDVKEFREEMKQKAREEKQQADANKATIP